MLRLEILHSSPTRLYDFYAKYVVLENNIVDTTLCNWSTNDPIISSAKYCCFLVKCFHMTNIVA